MAEAVAERLDEITGGVVRDLLRESALATGQGRCNRSGRQRSQSSAHTVDRPLTLPAERPRDPARLGVPTCPEAASSAATRPSSGKTSVAQCAREPSALGCRGGLTNLPFCRPRVEVDVVLRRLVPALAAVALACSPLIPAAHATTGDTGPYAPLNRPGPALSVPAGRLAASLQCSTGVSGARRAPVLLVPGTTLDPEPNFDWNYERAFDAQHRPWCAVRLPEHATGDVQIAGEYVVYALRTMSARAHRKVDVLGYSQGGMLPRWALRFWPDHGGRLSAVVLDCAEVCG